MSATRLEIVIFDGNLLFYGAPERFMDRCVFFVFFLVRGYLLECTSAHDSVTAGAGVEAGLFDLCEAVRLVPHLCKPFIVVTCS